jgi:uncharacterized protein YcbK (DUF882 family)
MIDRRHVLKLGLGAFVSFGSAPLAARTSRGPRWLALENVHTGERLHATYFESGRYLPDALGEINRILRDYRTDETIPMDVRLLDLLVGLRGAVGSSRPYQVVSGYRSPGTNTTLLEEGHAVAEHSYHVLGKAIDVRLSDRSPATLRRAAMALRRGGVGFYPRLEFVHIDVGPVRHW